MLPLILAFIVVQIAIFVGLYIFFESKPHKHNARVPTQEIQEDTPTPAAPSTSNNKTAPIQTLHKK